jgi:hypothetical protein
MQRWLIAICPAWLAVAACRSDAPDVIAPPPGVPVTCTAIAALSGCDQGSLSFSCTADRPDSGSAQLVCSAGTAGPGSAELYCCIPRTDLLAECTADVAIPGCGTTAVGFACVGSAAGPPTAPTNAEGTIGCSAGIAGSGSAVDYRRQRDRVPRHRGRLRVRDRRDPGRRRSVAGVRARRGRQRRDVDELLLRAVRRRHQHLHRRRQRRLHRGRVRVSLRRPRHARRPRPGADVPRRRERVLLFVAMTL